MAKKTVFVSTENNFYEEIVDYVFNPGFALVQKQKNVDSIEQAIKKTNPNAKVLEVSSKSKEKLGIKLSAFNLTLNGISVESIFQSSKVFVGGTQYSFLIDYPANKAKKYIKENARGQLKCFKYNNEEYPLFPKTAFYDYIYIKALIENKDISSKLDEYDVFTDVEFNSEKSINCQARTCAIYSFLLKSKRVNEFLLSFSKFVELYKFDAKSTLI